MTTATADRTEVELPGVANLHGVSTDALRRLLKRHPELAALVRRLRPNGPRLFGPEAIDLAGRLLSEREAAAAR